MVAGGLNGIFLDGFQGCDPFTKGGCARVCSSKAGCDPAVMARWNAGLRAAMWRLKREILGENGTFICNSTPGPYACVGNTSTPVEDCPCDGTNDERGGGNFAHEEIVDTIDANDGEYTMLTHVPHGNNKAVFLKSVPQFLMAASKYQYLGSGFGCVSLLAPALHARQFCPKWQRTPGPCLLPPGPFVTTLTVR